MDTESVRRKTGRYLIFSVVLGLFVIVASGQGFCDLGFNGNIHVIPLPSMISVSPNPVYVGQTVTVTGSGWNTTAYPGDPYPVVACSAGPGKAIKVNSDGTWSVETSYTGPGTTHIYAQDRWGHLSNVVNLTIVTPPAVTFKGTVYNGSTATLCTSGGSIYVKYPASMAGHYEENFFGSTYISSYPYNGTAAEVWAVRGTLKSEHLTIENIQPSGTYSFNLILPTPTPVPATATPVPLSTSAPSLIPGIQVTPTTQATALAQATATPVPGGNPTDTPGTPDTVAPVTVLNLTGLKDASGAFTTSVVCTLTPADNYGGSGVNETLYSYDGANWTTYAGPFTITAPGNYTLFYRSTDRAGNQEVAKVEAIAIAGKGAATPTAQASSGVCAAMLLPLLLVSLAGLYSTRKRR